MNITRLASVFGATSVAIAAALTVPSSALASNVKIESGAICHSVNPLDSVFSAGVSHGAYGVFKTGPNSAYLWCPLTKDNTTTTSGLEDLEVSYSSTNGGGFCQAHSTDRYGNGLDATDALNLVAGSDKVINFGSSLNVSDSKGTYGVLCAFPEGGTWIHSFYVREY